jgi:hypothetical protein
MSIGSPQQSAVEVVTGLDARCHSSLNLSENKFALLIYLILSETVIYYINRETPCRNCGYRWESPLPKPLWSAAGRRTVQCIEAKSSTTCVASLKRSAILFNFRSFQSNLQLRINTVGRTPWTGDQPVARQLPTHRTTQTQANIHALSGIRTHDPSVYTSEDISYLRSRDSCDRHLVSSQSVK